jgi:hypothetical protein
LAQKNVEKIGAAYAKFKKMLYICSGNGGGSTVKMEARASNRRFQKQNPYRKVGVFLLYIVFSASSLRPGRISITQNISPSATFF